MSFLKTTAIQHLNASTPSINLDANSKVGLGTSSPAEVLSVTGNIRLQTANSRVIGFNSTAPYVLNYSGGASIFFNTLGDGSQEIGFETHYSGNSHLERMRISKEGYVTRPYQPSFQVAKDDGGASLAGGQTILWNVISHNIGGNYNASTGRFTAPIAGRYYFSAFMLFGAGGTDSGQTFVFYINGSGSGYQPYTRSTGAQYVGMAGSVVFTLNAGDYVTVYIDAGGGPIYATGAKHNGFSGYLLG